MLLSPSAASAGTISASSARLGIVWITLATPSTGCSSQRLRREQHAGRNADQRADQQCKQRELQMRGQVPGQQCELLAHADPVPSRSSTTLAWRIGVSISWRT